MRREDLARAIEEAVLAVPGVARLSRGPGVEVSTLFAGGKVVGLRLSSDPVEVHLVADAAPLTPVAEAAAEAAMRALRAAGDERPVQVVIEDVEAVALDRRRSR